MEGVEVVRNLHPVPKVAVRVRLLKVAVEVPVRIHRQIVNKVFPTVDDQLLTTPHEHRDSKGKRYDI